MIAAAWRQQRQLSSGGGGGGGNTTKRTTKARRRPCRRCDGSSGNNVGQLRGDEDNEEDKHLALAAGQQQGGYDDGGDDRPPSFPANGEDKDAAVGNAQGDATAADVDGGGADAGRLSVVLPASNTPDHDNNANNNEADAKDAAGKKTLMRDCANISLCTSDCG